MIIQYSVSRDVHLSQKSSVHYRSNVAAGSILGYIGVSRGMVGVPFIQQIYFRNPALIGGAVYGVLGGLLAVFGGKQI